MLCNCYYLLQTSTVNKHTTQYNIGVLSPDNIANDYDPNKQKTTGSVHE